MKILYLSDDFPPVSFGGAGIVAFKLASSLEKMGHEVVVITTTRDKSDEGAVTYDGLLVHKIYTSYPDRFRAYLSLYNPQVMKKVREIISTAQPDVVHAHNIHQYLSYDSLRVAKKYASKVFLTAHDVMSFHYGKLTHFVTGADVIASEKKFNYKISAWKQFVENKRRYNPFRNMVIKFYLRNYVDRIFAVSDALRDALNHNCIFNVEVIHNGIDVKDWEVDLEKIDSLKQHYRLENKKVILFGGRLSEAKGGYQALNSLKEIVSRRRDVILLIIGKTNSFSEKMISLAKDWGIESNIVFTGWVSGDELKAIYHVSDIVLVPSIYLDPFPTVNLEAMACKKPVIATCFGGSREVVEDGVSGYVVNPLDTARMVEKIGNLLTDHTLMNQLGQRGYDKIMKNFNNENYIEEIMGYYRSESK